MCTLFTRWLSACVTVAHTKSKATHAGVCMHFRWACLGDVSLVRSSTCLLKSIRDLPGLCILFNVLASVEVLALNSFKISLKILMKETSCTEDQSACSVVQGRKEIVAPIYRSWRRVNHVFGIRLFPERTRLRKCLLSYPSWYTFCPNSIRELVKLPQGRSLSARILANTGNICVFINIYHDIDISRKFNAGVLGGPDGKYGCIGRTHMCDGMRRV
jgi:hypothetical protein